MKRGSFIIYDKKGNILLNTGDAEGDILPYEDPEELFYIFTEFGELKNKFLRGIDVKNKRLILEDIPKMETEGEKLKKEKEELENQLLLKENKDLGGIL